MAFVEQLARLSHPVIHAACLLILSALFAHWRRYRIAGALLFAAVFWLWLCSTPMFASWLRQGLAQQYPRTEASSYAKADAIVILGGGKLPRSAADWRSGTHHGQLTRVGFGMQLFRDARADVIVLSGNDQARKMTHGLLNEGVSANSLIIEDASANTHQNALYSARLLQHRGLHRILLVTSPIHMPRAAACFARQGLLVIPAPVPETEQGTAQPRRSWWPQRHALNISKHCLREYLGRWVYCLLGWA